MTSILARLRSRAAPRQAPDDTAVEDWLRAARVLALRTRREAEGLFVGSYASAFRGSGMEFEESRPYVPGDDVRHLDWSATARTGEPWVKRFREARDRDLVLLLDASASMGLGSTGRTKAVAAAHAAALLAAAAVQVGDRVGVVTIDDHVREEIAPAKGHAHLSRIVEVLLRSARSAGEGTRLEAPIDLVMRRARHRSSVVLLSDFRDPALRRLASEGPPVLAGLCRRHDVVSVLVYDPVECELPRVGRVRVADAERPGATRLVNASSRRARSRYQHAWQLRHRALERSLRSAGSDLLQLDATRDPLRPILQFFHERASRPRRGPR